MGQKISGTFRSKFGVFRATSETDVANVANPALQELDSSEASSPVCFGFISHRSPLEGWCSSKSSCLGIKGASSSAPFLEFVWEFFVGLPSPLSTFKTVSQRRR